MLTPLLLGTEPADNQTKIQFTTQYMDIYTKERQGLSIGHRLFVMAGQEESCEQQVRVSLTCRSLSRSALLATSTMGNSDLVGERRRGRKKEGKKKRNKTKNRRERERERRGEQTRERRKASKGDTTMLSSLLRHWNYFNPSHF